MNQIVFQISIQRDGKKIHSFDLKSVDQLVGAFSILQSGMSLTCVCSEAQVKPAQKAVM